MKRILAMVMATFLLFQCAHIGYADSPFGIAGEMYPLKDVKNEAGICWYANTGLGRDEVNLWKCLSLATGKEEEFVGATGYVIQKDPSEYPGILVAVETDDALTILHVDENIDAEIVYTSAAILPFEYKGRQTVRAYMRGVLYSVETPDSPAYDEIQGLDENGEGYTMTKMLNSTSGRMCAKKEDGSVYRYSLSSKCLPGGQFQQSLIDGYAIRTDGALAWTDVENDNRILLETMDGIIECIVERSDVKAVDEEMNGIQRNGLGWMKDGSLCFVVSAQNESGLAEYRLMRWKDGVIAPVASSTGEEIRLIRKVEEGSGLYFSPDGNYVAYFGSPDRGFSGDGFDLSNYDLPILLNLETGESGFIYEYEQSDHRCEFRATRGQLSWCAQS